MCAKFDPYILKLPPINLFNFVLLFRDTISERVMRACGGEPEKKEKPMRVVVEDKAAVLRKILNKHNNKE
jgi:hypothetical protein